MRRFLERIYRYQIAGWTFAAAYIYFTIRLHDTIQLPVFNLHLSRGMVPVHYSILAVFLMAGFLFFWLIRKTLREHTDGTRMWIAGGVLLVLAWAEYHFLMVRSIEIIHFAQYLILALLLCALTRSTLLAVLMACLVGLADEAWQYFYLHSWQPYYDFNDVNMNVLGAILGGWTFEIFSESDSRKSLDRYILAGWGACACLVFVLLAAGTFTVYQQDEGIALVRRKPPTAESPVRYAVAETWGNTWYRLHPYTGSVIFILLPLGTLAFLPPKKRRLQRTER